MDQTLNPDDVGRRSLSATVVEALIEQDLVKQGQRLRAEQVIADALRADRPVDRAAPPLSRRLSEVAGYVGGALVVGAAGLFLANEWSSMAYGVRLGFLVVTTVVLAAAATALVVAGGGPRTVRTSTEAVRRRLASTLTSGAAVCGAFAAGMQVDHVTGSEDSLPLLAAAMVLLAIGLAGYLVAPTVLGQLVPAAAAWLGVFSGLDVAGVGSDAVPGLLLLLIGAAWVALTESGLVRERDAGRVIGCATALFGAQWPIFGWEHAWVVYLLTALVGIAAFTLYVGRRAWPYLATGVAAVTIVVPEAVSDWTDGGLGAAGVLLVSGVTLLLAALAGLRLRRELAEPEG